MREVLIFIADDGTEFEDEWECREYEWQTKVGDEFLFSLLDSKHKVLNPIDPASYENAWFIFIPDLKAFNQLHDAWDGDWVDTCCPRFLHDYEKVCGLWAYDEHIDSRDGWYHVGNYIQQLQDKATEIMAVINGV